MTWYNTMFHKTFGLIIWKHREFYITSWDLRQKSWKNTNVQKWSLCLCLFKWSTILVALLLRPRLPWSPLHRDGLLAVVSSLLYCFIFIYFIIYFIALIYVLHERFGRPHLIFLISEGVCTIWGMTYFLLRQYWGQQREGRGKVTVEGGVRARRGKQHSPDFL